jgi:hypothetical protein
MRTLFVIASLLAPVPAAAQSACPTTASSNRQQFIPPAPHAALLERGMFWFGSEKMWVALREDGYWSGLYRADLKAHRNKLPLYRTGFDSRREREPRLTVTARRIDQPASIGSIMAEPPHGVSDGTNSFIMTALDLPAGCWRINAQYATEAPLTFVVEAP